MNIFVIGCGRWGSLITWYLDHIGHHVTLYGRQSSPRMQSFLATRQNDLLTLPDSVGLTTDLRDVEQAETVINDAKAYQNAQLPQAQAQADQLIQNAEYLKQKRINEAIEKVALFEAMYSEYAQNPAITRTRMYYEAISQVLPGVKLYINTGGQGGDVQMLLPLESLAGTEGGNTI